jgi:hypothetical protein
MAEPDLTLLRARLSQLEKNTGGGGGPPHIPPMNDERIGKIEGQIEGIKHSHNVGLVSLGGGIALVAAVLVALAAYSLAKIDQTNDRLDKITDKVNELPGKISAELRDINKTLAEAITAAKQAPTQVIMVPTPLPPPTPQPRPQQ